MEFVATNQLGSSHGSAPSEFRNIYNSYVICILNCLCVTIASGVQCWRCPSPPPPELGTAKHTSEDTLTGEQPLSKMPARTYYIKERAALKHAPARTHYTKERAALKHTPARTHYTKERAALKHTPVRTHYTKERAALKHARADTLPRKKQLSNTRPRGHSTKERAALKHMPAWTLPSSCTCAEQGVWLLGSAAKYQAPVGLHIGCLLMLPTSHPCLLGSLSLLSSPIPSAAGHGLVPCRT